MEIDVKYIANLAHLELSEAEEEKFKGQLEDVIKMINNIPTLENVEMKLDPNNKMELRKDEVQPSLTREEVLMNAKQIEAGCVVVPRTVD